MGRRKVAGIIGAVMVAASLSGPPPAQAAGAGTFECAANINPWPGSGSAAPCSGTARGIFQPHVCIPFCTFEMSVDSYSNACLLNEPPLVSSLSGGIYLNGLRWRNYDATIVGTHLTLFLSPTGEGQGEIVMSIPLPTCAAPGPLRYFIEGELSGT